MNCHDFTAIFSFFIRYTEQSFRRDALNGLERCAGELVSEMVALIESEEDPEEGQVRMGVG
jgi:hypothetical protein